MEDFIRDKEVIIKCYNNAEILYCKKIEKFFLKL